MRYNLSIATVFITALLVLTACQNAAETKKTEAAKTNTSSASTPKVENADPADAAPRITLAEAKKDFDAGNVVFVDTRAEVSYKQEHIKGAINVPAEAMETRYKEIPTDKKIIAYCS